MVELRGGSWAASLSSANGAQPTSKIGTNPPEVTASVTASTAVKCIGEKSCKGAGAAAGIFAALFIILLVGVLIKDEILTKVHFDGCINFCTSGCIYLCTCGCSKSFGDWVKERDTRSSGSSNVKMETFNNASEDSYEVHNHSTEALYLEGDGMDSSIVI
jgi:hypothetical protein